MTVLGQATGRPAYNDGTMMVKDQRVRRQHVVSQFYLKEFANGDNQVRRVDLPGDRSHLLATSDASVIKDFYTVTLPDRTQSDMFERAFADVEGPASSALRSVVSGTWPLVGEAREALAMWMALQHLRSEGVRADQGTLDAEMIHLIVGSSGKAALRRVIERAEGRTVPDDELDREWRDLTKPGGPDLVPDVDKHLLLLTEMLPGMTRLLRDCNWMLITFKRRALITSDHPVSLLRDPEGAWGPSVGIATADAYLVPLARRYALLLQPPHRLLPLPGGMPETRQDGTTKWAHSLNQETARRARRHIYHHPDDDPLEPIVLPQPQSRGPAMSNIDALVNEEGIFHGLKDSDRPEIARPALPQEDGDTTSMTIDDLPWPIPGRRSISDAS